MYFLALLGFYLYIKSGDGGATAAYVSTVSVGLIGGAAAYVVAVLRSRGRRLEALVTKLVGSGTLFQNDEEARAALVERVFSACDSDRSGTLDQKEARVLLSVLHEKLSKGVGAELEDMLGTLRLDTPGGVTLPTLKESVDDFIEMLRPVIYNRSYRKTTAGEESALGEGEVGEGGEGGDGGGGDGEGGGDMGI